MGRYEIRNGSKQHATIIGKVVAMDEHEAIEVLQAFKKGFKVTEPGEIGVPNAYVEWAHPKLDQLSDNSISHWRALRNAPG